MKLEFSGQIVENTEVKFDENLSSESRVTMWGRIDCHT
jgi:hypothetical protein